MTSKPVVVLALSPSVAGQMFSCEDLERLRAVAEVLGPVEEAIVTKMIAAIQSLAERLLITTS